MLAALVWWLLPEDDGIDVVQRVPIAFNLRYPPELERLSPQGGELLHLERRRDDDLFVDSFAVEPLALPPYDGDAAGMLPAYADREIASLRERYRELELQQEGKARINEVAGYAISFRARLGERRLYGRVVLLPEPRPGARRGVRLVMLATPASGATSAQDVGVRGAIKIPYRTFRFGTEKP